jgi:hypothetical protein
MRPSKVRPSHGVMAALILLVALTTAIRFDNGPIYDDSHIIERAGIIHRPELALESLRHRTTFITVTSGPAPAVDTYRPIPVLTFFLNAAISGKKLWSYHLLNLFLHTGCVLLLFAFLRRWLGGGRLKAAALGSALFAVQPWLAEAHVWINGRSDPLALAFGLGAALVLLRREATPGRLALAGALFFLGLLSKETLLPTIPAFFFLDPKGGLSFRRRAKMTLPLVIAAAVYVFIRIRVLEGMRTHSDPQALRTAASRGPALVFDALYHLVVPWPPFLRSLRDDYAGVPSWLLALGFVALALVFLLVLRVRRRLPSAPFAALFFVGSLAPIAGITMELWPGYGRYLYLPAAGLALVVAETLPLVARRIRDRRVAMGIAGAYLFANAVLLVGFTTTMSSNESFYLSATEHRPQQAYGWGFLGIYYATIEQNEPAIGALKRAVTLEPNEHRYRSRLALLLSENDRCREAVPLASGGLDRYESTSAAAVFHLVLARCAPTTDLAVRNLHLCILTNVNVELDECETRLRDRIKADPNARDALRAAMAAVPNPAFDVKWSARLREHE